MFKNHSILYYLKFSIAAAILYSIAAGIFLHDESYSKSWVLYIGNMLFALVIIIFILSYNKKNANSKATMIVGAGHITTIMGIIVACIICAILVFTLVPGLINSSAGNPVLHKAPPQMYSGSRHELIFALFFNTIIGNVCGGSFFSIMLAYLGRLKPNKKYNP